MVAVDEFTELLDAPMYVVTTAVDHERSGCLVGFTSQCSLDPVRLMSPTSRPATPVPRPGDRPRCRGAPSAGRSHRRSSYIRRGTAAAQKGQAAVRPALRRRPPAHQPHRLSGRPARQRGDRTSGREGCAVYRDESGQVGVVFARCTHLGCLVQINDVERALPRLPLRYGPFGGLSGRASRGGPP